MWSVRYCVMKAYFDFVSVNFHSFDHEVHSYCGHLTWREEPLEPHKNKYSIKFHSDKHM